MPGHTARNKCCSARNSSSSSSLQNTSSSQNSQNGTDSDEGENDDEVDENIPVLDSVDDSDDEDDETSSNVIDWIPQIIENSNTGPSNTSTRSSSTSTSSSASPATDPVTIDDMLPKFKKPEKWHFKVFALNDAITGYMCDFYSDEGASEVRDEDVKATTQPILKLFCENQTYRNRNHVFITDNWYTGMENLWHWQSLFNGSHI